MSQSKILNSLSFTGYLEISLLSRAFHMNGRSLYSVSLSCLSYGEAVLRSELEPEHQLWRERPWVKPEPVT